MLHEFLNHSEENTFLKCPLCGKEAFLIIEDSFICLHCDTSGDLEFLKYKLKKENEIETTIINERLISLNKDAMIYFKNALNHYPEAKKYLLEERSLPADIVSEFEIGYANSDWTSAKQYLMKRGYTEEELIASGILFKSNKNGKTYDFYRNRIMFPIKNSFGQVIGFSGRYLEKQQVANENGKKNPKYINTNENDVFRKREGFYNIDHFNEKHNYIILCEGQMDTIAFYIGGISNAIATLGTALTSTQACIIKNLVDVVYLCFDNDKAGENALAKAVDLLKEAGVKDIRRVRCVSGKDPDEVLKKEGPEGLHQMMKQNEIL